MVARSVIDVLAETVTVAGRDVLDVGCGNGAVVRWLGERGAQALGAECGALMRRQALEADPDNPHRYVDAPGENLPFDDASFDLLIYANSLHHVPIALIPQALREACRVLRTGGLLCVIEPDVMDRDYAVGFPVTDERAPLSLVQGLLADPGRFGFGNPQHSRYDREDVYTDFQHWERAAVTVDPERATLMDQHREQIRERFIRLAEHRDGTYVLAGVSKLTVLPAV